MKTRNTKKIDGNKTSSATATATVTVTTTTEKMSKNPKDLEDQSAQAHPASTSVTVNTVNVPGFRNPDIKALTKGLFIEKPLPLPVVGRTIKKRKPLFGPVKDGVFTEGRQRPNGPVKTFIVFKATGRRVKNKMNSARSKSKPRDEGMEHKQTVINLRLGKAIRRKSADHLQTDASIIMNASPQGRSTSAKRKNHQSKSLLSSKIAKIGRRLKLKSASSKRGRSSSRTMNRRQRSGLTNGLETGLKSRIVNVLRWKNENTKKLHQ